MEKYLVDTAPVRQSRPADYRCDAATERDNADDDVVVGGRVTPSLHVHDPASLRPAIAASLDVKPLRAGTNSDGKYGRLGLGLLLTSGFTNLTL